MSARAPFSSTVSRHMLFRTQRFARLSQSAALKLGFEKLHEVGILCGHGVGYTLNDGWEDMSQQYHRLPTPAKEKMYGICFFHEQDMERAVRSEGLSLAFGGVKAEDDVRVASEVCVQLRNCGLV